jgi:hypothetical protein
METTSPIPNALNAVCNLTLADIEQRFAELDAERAQLSSLRRSLVARERAKRRAVLRTGEAKAGGPAHGIG